MMASAAAHGHGTSSAVLALAMLHKSNGGPGGVGGIVGGGAGGHGGGGSEGVGSHSHESNGAPPSATQGGAHGPRPESAKATCRHSRSQSLPSNLSSAAAGHRPASAAPRTTRRGSDEPRATRRISVDEPRYTPPEVAFGAHVVGSPVFRRPGGGSPGGRRRRGVQQPIRPQVPPLMDNPAPDEPMGHDRPWLIGSTLEKKTTATGPAALAASATAAAQPEPVATPARPASGARQTSRNAATSPPSQESSSSGRSLSPGRSASPTRSPPEIAALNQGLDELADRVARERLRLHRVQIAATPAEV